MIDTVYDATVVGLSNEDLDKRQDDDQLDSRLKYLEECLRGHRIPFYNDKLSREYTDHLHDIHNDVVQGFIEALDLRGKKGKRSTLSRTDFARSRPTGWPSHDQHLLAAALEGSETHIVVTEDILAGCGPRIWREFRFRVIKT